MPSKTKGLPPAERAPEKSLTSPTWCHIRLCFVFPLDARAGNILMFVLNKPSCLIAFANHRLIIRRLRCC